MIPHLAQLWAALFVAFAVGCPVGALLFRLLERGRFASLQWRLTAVLARAGDGIRVRFGATPLLLTPRRPPPRPARIPAALAEATPDSFWDLIDQAVASVDAGEVRVAPSPVRAFPAPASTQVLRAEVAYIGDDDALAAAPSTEESSDASSPGRAGDDVTLPDPPTDAAPAPAPQPPFPLALLPPIRPASPSDAAPRKVAPLPTAAKAASSAAIAAQDTRRPAMLPTPRNGVPDNLQRIRGIGERNEIRLNRLGIFHYSQIASWTAPEVRWIGQKLAFPERIERDDWVGQALVLAGGGVTGFTKAAERRRARRRMDGEDRGPVPEDEDDALPFEENGDDNLVDAPPDGDDEALPEAFGDPSD